MKRVFTILAILALLSVAVAAQVTPDGASVAPGDPETKSTLTPESVAAQGGNITPVDLAGETQTQNWQGFYGNVSGNLTLQDSDGDELYNWPVSNLSGEVFASLNSTFDWTTVAGVTDCQTDEVITGIGNDRVNETYFPNSSVSFSVAGTSITDACQTFTFVSSAAQSTDFEAIILNATTANNTAYATRINASSPSFDGGLNDYQLIVPANQTVLTYFFYVEFN